MDPRAELRQFLVSRRAKIHPEQAGVPTRGAHRRSGLGLSREDLAMLAGISTDQYVQLERGNLDGVSGEVLEAVARVLQLGGPERNHLFELARPSGSAREPAPRRRPSSAVRPSLQWMLDSMVAAPAFVGNRRLDVVATNQLGRAFYSPMFDGASEAVNVARFCFLDPRSHEFYSDWNGSANDTVAQLRMAAGRDQPDRALYDLVGELATRSEEFRTRWASHDLRLHHTGTRRFRHPIAGKVKLAYNTIPLPSDPDLMLTVYTAEPGSPTEDALRALASWTATRTDESAELREADRHSS